MNAVGAVVKGNEFSLSSWLDSASHGIFLCTVLFAHQSFEGMLLHVLGLVLTLHSLAWLLLSQS